jgi:hypothetical protein
VAGLPFLFIFVGNFSFCDLAACEKTTSSALDAWWQRYYRVWPEDIP